MVIDDQHPHDRISLFCTSASSICTTGTSRARQWFESDRTEEWASNRSDTVFQSQKFFLPVAA
jgi:hypothetical protein